MAAPDLLLLCLAHRPDVACRELLDVALASQNLQATASILAYGHLLGDSVRNRACSYAVCIPDHGLRYEFFKVLVACDLVTDDWTLPDELMKDVKARQLPLIKLLADAGVTLDTAPAGSGIFGSLPSLELGKGLRMEPNTAFHWAVRNMDLEILECFKGGKLSAGISTALKFVPESITESDMLRFVEILGPRGLDVQWLNSWLIRAVRSRHIELVKALIRYGASIEFKQASSVQIALENADFGILGILLLNECSPTILSSTIPTAMALTPNPIRLQAMEALVKKGVLPQELLDQLGRLIVGDDDLDSELIQLLLQNGGPGVGLSNDIVAGAASRGDLSILKKVCDAGPRSEALSEAVPTAFTVSNTCGYDVALDMIKLLLQKGAAGEPIHSTLLDAAG